MPKTHLKGKTLERAMATKDADRLLSDNNVPLITDETIFITSAIAKEMLLKNKSNRPINWNKVEEYSKLMKAGKWKFHAQGIILDGKGNLITGQKRLWAIIYSDIPQHMRVSQRSPQSTANLIDRGTSQSSRDLASRETERKHAVVEAGIARAILAIAGNTKPSFDDIAAVMTKHSEKFSYIVKESRRIKKTPSVKMIFAAICVIFDTVKLAERAIAMVEELSRLLDRDLYPADSKGCWNKGAAFMLAMEKASNIVKCNIS